MEPPGDACALMPEGDETFGRTRPKTGFLYRAVEGARERKCVSAATGSRFHTWAVFA
jgi:hypothetical protein